MADLRRVYLDSCCFIDMVKTEVGKSLDQARECDVWYMKQLLMACRAQEIEVYTSTLTISECSHGGDGDIDNDIKSIFNKLLMSGQYVRLVQLTPFIARDARDLRWEKGIALKGADAVHVASALYMKCEEFISNDKRFERIGKYSRSLTRLDIAMKTAQQTDCLPQKYLQLDLPDNL